MRTHIMRSLRRNPHPYTFSSVGVSRPPRKQIAPNSRSVFPNLPYTRSDDAVHCWSDDGCKRWYDFLTAGSNHNRTFVVVRQGPFFTGASSIFKPLKPLTCPSQYLVTSNPHIPSAPTGASMSLGPALGYHHRSPIIPRLRLHPFQHVSQGSTG